MAKPVVIRLELDPPDHQLIREAAARQAISMRAFAEAAAVQAARLVLDAPRGSAVATVPIDASPLVTTQPRFVPVQAAPLMPPIAPSAPEGKDWATTVQDERCPVCDWPYRADGCLPGDCCYRPDPNSPEGIRIAQRRAALAKSELQPVPRPEDYL